jgi:hypothetical protein
MYSINARSDSSWLVSANKIAVQGVLALLILLIFTGYLEAATNNQIILSIEEPENNSSYSGISNIRGWVIAPQKIDHLELYIDGVFKANIPYGGRRTDVGISYPTYPNSDNSGFSMAFNYSNLSAGTHTIGIRAVDINENELTSTVDFSIVRFDNSFITDSPDNFLSGAAVSSDNRSIYIHNLLAGGKKYNVRLEWYAATQGFVIREIQAAENIPGQGILLGTYTGQLDGKTTQCVPPEDDNSFSLSGDITITNQNGSNFSGSGTLQTVRSGVLFTLTLRLDGTLSADNKFTGSYSENFSGANGFASSGNGTFTGSVTNTLSFQFQGTDTDNTGTTCTASGSFTGVKSP